jgi:hypothetical protein
VYLLVDGLPHAPRRAQVTVTTATDDLGTDISPDSRTSRREDDASLSTSQSSRSGMDAVRVRVNLSLSPRRARRIAALKGEIRLTIGTDKTTVKVPGAMELRGKPVHEPKLAQAGLSIQVGEQGSHLKKLSLLVSGDGANEVETAVVDDAGKPISGSGSAGVGENYQAPSWELARPLRASDALLLTFPTRLSEVKVPFDLTDINLP